MRKTYRYYLSPLIWMALGWFAGWTLASIGLPILWSFLAACLLGVCISVIDEVYGTLTHRDGYEA